MITDPRKAKGELLWPERFGPKEIEELKRNLGPFGISGQLQQNPAPIGGGMIHRDWILHYKSIEGRCVIEDYNGTYRPDPWSCLRFFTLDLATTEKDLVKKDKPDYSVIAVWAGFRSTRGVFLILLDLVREHLTGPEHVSRVKAMADHWQPAVIAVEDIGGFKNVYQYMQRAGLPVREISTKVDALYRIDKDKVARALAATPLMADRRFYVPEYSSWLGDYINELITFPVANHDDQVDVTAFACAIVEKIMGAEHPIYEEFAKEDNKYAGIRDSHGWRDPDRDKPETRSPLTGFITSDDDPLQGFRSGG